MSFWLKFVARPSKSFQSMLSCCFSLEAASKWAQLEQHRCALLAHFSEHPRCISFTKLVGLAPAAVRLRALLAVTDVAIRQH